ncbi:UDP-N-acetylmuramoyl-tripeptide--D-alanyl-D-alanine ligase [candidate division KSB1 bacterium]|nr:MAG: UDP-N-acetylmuramoyl-tripeptide--D-alanyl-D-alanine ligase [candidate division KSB1 bacterium]
MILLEDILKIKNIETDFNCKNYRSLKFSGVSIDSRTTGKDDLFIAIKGERFDGHNFLDDVVKKGIKASIVTTERYTDISFLRNKILFFKVKDTLKALQELGKIQRRKFARKVFAITGTNGKTTTKEMLYSILNRCKKVLKSPGNYNNQYGVPLTLLKLNDKCDAVIVEMGASRKGEIEELCKIAEPDIGIITCIGRGHLEFFKSVENVAETKAEMLEYLGETGTAIVNIDDKYLKPHLSKAKNIITFGLNKNADVKGKIISEYNNFTSLFKINDVIEVKLQAAGEKNILNALAAAAAGFKMGISYNDIKEGLESYQPFSGRLQIKKFNGYTLIDDTYNSNPESLSEAISIMSNKRISGRKFAVLGDMLELGKYSEQEHKKIGKLICEKGIDYVFTYGNFAELITEECKKCGITNSQHFTDKFEIINSLKKLLKEGDLILVKGSRGMKMEDIVNGLKKLI